MIFKEDLLQYIWKYRLFEAGSLSTTKGETIQIASPGIQNFHSGPDFKNARIYINDSVFIGNVELHVDPSDWYAHSHHLDFKYNSVILHVSLNPANIKISTLDGRSIPQLVLKGKIDRTCIIKYDLLSKNSLNIIPCAKLFSEVSFLLQYSYGELLQQRIIRKSQDVSKVLIDNDNNYSNSFVIYLIAKFGMKFNNEGFQLLSENVDFDLLINSNQFHKEALLLGWAGLLKHSPSDEYERSLLKAYRYLTNTQQDEVKISNWKFARIRPNNFPTIRISQLAAILSSSNDLWKAITEVSGLEEIRQIFMRNAGEYWRTHYTFGKNSTPSTKIVGNKSIDHVIINVVVPFMYHYGNAKGRTEFVERSLNLLYECKPEDNAIVSIWKELGVKTNNAAQTQALTQLKTEFCDKFRCLQCMLGRKLLKEKKL